MSAIILISQVNKKTFGKCWGAKSNTSLSDVTTTINRSFHKKKENIYTPYIYIYIREYIHLIIDWDFAEESHEFGPSRSDDDTEYWLQSGYAH